MAFTFLMESNVKSMPLDQTISITSHNVLEDANVLQDNTNLLIFKTDTYGAITRIQDSVSIRSGHQLWRSQIRPH